MRAHVGVGSQSKVFRSAAVTPTNTADCTVMKHQLRVQ
jgi:hypothetical protein